MLPSPDIGTLAQEPAESRGQPALGPKFAPERAAGPGGALDILDGAEVGARPILAPQKHWSSLIVELYDSLCNEHVDPR